MEVSKFKEKAKEILAGKWNKAALLCLAFFGFEIGIGIIFSILNVNENISSIVSTIISVPVSYGMMTCYWKLYNNEDFKYFDFLQIGFSNFVRAWGISIWMFIKMIIPTVIVVISIILIAICGVAGNSSLVAICVVTLIIGSIWMVMKSFAFQLAYLVAIDDQSLLSADCVSKSESLMAGRKMNLFWLEVSFVGWVIVAALTIGFGFLWLIPYMQMSLIAFYKND